jgi:hypothetical protein
MQRIFYSRHELTSTLYDWGSGMAPAHCEVLFHYVQYDPVADYTITLFRYIISHTPLHTCADTLHAPPPVMCHVSTRRREELLLAVQNKNNFL